LIALLLCAWLASQPARAEPPPVASEIATSLEAARGAWRQGRLEDAASHYKYVLSVRPDDFEATVNLALVLRDLGRVRESLPLWLKASLLRPDDPLLRAEFGWARLSLGDMREARAAFKDALTVSTAPMSRSEALLGLSLTALLDDNLKQAADRLREAFVLQPYWLGAESHLLALSSRKARRDAIVHERQALSQDPLQRESLLDLAELYDKTGATQLAFQTLQTLLRVSPADPELRRRAGKAAKYVDAPDELLGIRRMAWPMQRSPQVRGGSPLAIGLFADDQGSLAELTSVRFVSTSDFKVEDERLGAAAEGKAKSQWELRWSPERELFELYDSQGALRHATKEAVTITPLTPGASVLLKSARAADWRGADPGDRELLGSVIARRAGKGFVLVNKTTLESVVPSMTSLTLPASELVEAYKAAAVVSRTQALNDAAERHRGAPYGLCDSRHCQMFRGVQSETGLAVEGAKATEGETLSLSGRRLAARSHTSCAGATEPDATPSAIDSSGTVVSSSDPWQLERFVRSEAPGNLADRNSPYVAPSTVRWLRLIDLKEVRRRSSDPVLSDPPIALTPLGRTPGGRALGLRWKTRSASKDLTPAETEQALSPGTLRSQLWSMWPLYDGKEARWALLFGAATGDGRGLCRAGTLGYAAHGAKYRDILAHYFEGSEVIREK
jgi:peptidoglycan hydrolase-like amidase/tetratricopeptide (TPR) repeat protein